MELLQILGQLEFSDVYFCSSLLMGSHSVEVVSALALKTVSSLSPGGNWQSFCVEFVLPAGVSFDAGLGWLDWLQHLQPPRNPKKDSAIDYELMFITDL